MSSVPEWWRKPRDVVVVVDTPGWFDQHGKRLVEAIAARGDHARFARSHREIGTPDVAFYLSCTKIVPKESLAAAQESLVAHASDLPKGRGFSPVVWQILEGRREIPIRLIRAEEAVDSGDILLSESIAFEGHELNDEIRDRLGRQILAMCLFYLQADTPPAGTPQSVEPTWYPRRHPDDSRLDPQRSIAEQFDLLRVVDNVRYPAFFDLRGHRYLLRIEKVEPVRQRGNEEHHD